MFCSTAPLRALCDLACKADRLHSGTPISVICDSWGTALPVMRSYSESLAWIKISVLWQSFTFVYRAPIWCTATPTSPTVPSLRPFSTAPRSRISRTVPLISTLVRAGWTHRKFQPSSHPAPWQIWSENGSISPRPTVWPSQATRFVCLWSTFPSIITKSYASKMNVLLYCWLQIFIKCFFLIIFIMTEHCEFFFIFQREFFFIFFLTIFFIFLNKKIFIFFHNLLVMFC